MNEELQKKYVTLMQELSLDSDAHESIHGDADTLLCDLLTELGYADVVSIFDGLIKWYA